VTVCAHANLAAPPPGKHLRVCLDCLSRVLECSTCGVIAATPAETDDWRKGGRIESNGERFDWYACPRCQR